MADLTPEIDTCPMQAKGPGRVDGRIPRTVHMRAYAVYVAVYGSQTALITDGCRGGFSTGELIAFLYAYPFPTFEWRDRVEEAFRGMKNG